MRVHWLLLLGIGIVVGGVGGYVLASTPKELEGSRVPAWLEVGQRICTSVGGLGTFAALIYVIRQFNLLGDQNNLVHKNILASLDGQLYSRLDSFNKFIVDHDEEYSLLDKPYTEGVPTRKAKIHHLCDLGFSFYEQIFKHHQRYELVETEDWDEWQSRMVHFFGKPYVCGYWQATQDRYARSFRNFVQGLVSTMNAQRSQRKSD
jgi:hypothetical protein